jgi:hypothetical protein
MRRQRRTISLTAGLPTKWRKRWGMARLERPGCDPLAEFRAMLRNPRWYAEYWLRYGTRHPSEHFVITARIDDWSKRVDEAGPEIPARLLAELPPEGNA